jgi:hypothetical protein
LQIYFFFKNKLNTNGDLMGSQKEKWPRGLPRHEQKLPCGVTALGRNGEGPWVAFRVASVGTAAEKGRGLSIAVSKASKDDDSLKLNKPKVRFVVTDGAFDALSSADAVLPELPNCRFHSEDESHLSLTCLKHAMVADEEIAITDALFVSGKQPYSLAKFHYADITACPQALREGTGRAMVSEESQLNLNLAMTNVFKESVLPCCPLRVSCLSGGGRSGCLAALWIRAATI